MTRFCACSNGAWRCRGGGKRDLLACTRGDVA
jgi:hypothetical protein